MDRRGPTIGFVSRDEAVILSTEQRFCGKRALEVGCWLGWSTCHLALAGVSLDVLDPALADPSIRTSVEASLTAAGVRGRVNLVPAASPEGVTAFADGRKWSLFFVDGDREGSAPVRDAEACAAHAEGDALVLFHDLTAPAVGAALDRLRELGWRTVVYHTMQIMGAAWRGSGARRSHARPRPSRGNFRGTSKRPPWSEVANVRPRESGSHLQNDRHFRRNPFTPRHNRPVARGPHVSAPTDERPSEHGNRATDSIGIPETSPALGSGKG